MATNLPALSSISTAAGALSGLILVSPQTTVGYQPQPQPGNNGVIQPQQSALVFDYEGEQTVEIEDDITDHYVEDNTAIQDQVALAPVYVKTDGFIAELNDIAPNAVLSALQTIASKLTLIGAYTPVISATAIIAYNEAAFAYSIAASAANSAISTWQAITGGGESVINGTTVIPQPNQTKQQKMFQQFFGYRANRTLFTVQTPWAIFQNMIIKSLHAIQDPDTNTISTFSVRFKQMRFATSASGEVTLDSANRAANQRADQVDLGVQTPPLSSTSFTTAVSAVA